MIRGQPQQGCHSRTGQLIYHPSDVSDRIGRARGAGSFGSLCVVGQVHQLNRSLPEAFLLPQTKAAGAAPTTGRQG